VNVLRVFALGLTGAFVGAVAAACSDNPSNSTASAFDDRDASDIPGQLGDDPRVREDGGTKVVGPLFGGGSGGGDGGRICAETSANATPVPLYLVIMFDRSGSMADDEKWTSCKGGIEAFLADAGSAGMSASLHFFPQFFRKPAECSSGSYSTPAVAMTALPDATSFKAALDAEGPYGGTPTVPAIRGAIAYAETQATAHPNEKVVIVLVTDGMPNDCDSTVEDAASAEAAVADRIPTYVIGVGPEAASLDALAVGGGTGKAINVDTSDSTKIAGDFQTALQWVRIQALGCDFAIPEPPAGQTLDYPTLKVRYADGNGATTELAYNAACTGGEGWRYDDAKAPKRIQLCADTCSRVRNDPAAKVSIATGCKDVVR
jgi:hypothetical protein